MGRMLAVGVPVKICFYKNHGKGENKKYKIMQKEVSKYIDLSLYDTEQKEYSLTLKLKKEVFDKNINKTLIDFYNKFDFIPNRYFEGDYADLELLKQKKYHLELVYNDNEHKEGVINYTISKDDVYELEHQFPQEYWLIYDSKVNDSWGYEYELYIKYSPVWMDIDKIDSEDESNLLRILNKMKITTFEGCNELTKTLMFFILG